MEQDITQKQEISHSHEAEKVLAHVIEYEGRKYPLSIAKISTDAKSVEIYPFEVEEEGVRFVNGSVKIEKNDSDLFFFVFP